MFFIKSYKNILWTIVFTLLITIVTSAIASAQGNNVINYQAKITNLSDETTVSSGDASCINGGADTCDFRVNLYDEAAAGNLLFQEVHENIEVGDYNGTFQFFINSVCLDWAAQGSPPTGCTGSPTVDGIDWGSDPTIYIEIEFDDDGNGDFVSPETFERKLIAANPYSYFANTAGQLAGLGIESFVQFQPGSAQAINTSTSGSLLFLNENGAATPNFVEFKIGGVDQFIIDNNGNISIGGGTDAFLDIKAATTDKSQINFSTSVGINPSTPIAGDLWFNGTEFYGYDGSSSVDFLAPTSVFTDSGTVSYLTDTSEDFAIGGTTIANSVFSIDVNLGDFYFGSSGLVDPSLVFENTNTTIANLNFNANSNFELSNSTNDVKVGINTDNPDEALDVVGDIQFSGTLYSSENNLIPISLAWVKAIGGAETLDTGIGITSDTNLNTYAMGTYRTTIDFDPDNVVSGDTPTSAGTSVRGFLAKYDEEGLFQWVVAPVGTTDLEPEDIEIDSSGNVYWVGSFVNASLDFDPNNVVAGDTHSSAGGDDMYIAKYNSSGTVQWVKALGSTGTDEITGIALDSSDNIYVNGVFSGTVDFDEDNVVTDDTPTAAARKQFIAKYNSSGTLQWVKDFANEAAPTSYEIFVDSSTNIYVSGLFTGTQDFDPDNVVSGDSISNTGSYPSGFFAKYDSTGILQWVKGLDASGSAGNVYNIFSDGTDNYISGTFTGSVDFDADNDFGFEFKTSIDLFDGYIAKYDTDGNIQWVNQLPYITPLGLDMDQQGNIISAGSFEDTSDFDDFSISDYDTIASNGGTDAFIASYRPAGNLFKIRTFGGTGDDAVNDVSLDADDNVLSTGEFEGTTDFEAAYVIEGDTHDSAGNEDLFIMKSTSTTIYTGSDLGTSLKPFSNVYVTNLNILGEQNISSDVTLTSDYAAATPTITYGTAASSLENNDVGQWSDITVNQDGNPVIAFRNATTAQVGIMVCGNTTCTSSNEINYYTWASSVDDGDYGVSVVINPSNLPIVSFHSTTFADHVLVRCSDYQCTSATITAVDNDNGGRYSDIIMSSLGNPVMFSQHGPDDRLESRSCTTETCAAFNSGNINDDTATNTGVYPSAVVKSNGLITVAYHDETNGDLKILDCTTAICSGGEVGKVLIDENTTPGSADSGEWIATARNHDGFPLIAYQDATNTDVYLLICKDLSCSTFDSVPIIVDGDDNGDLQIGLATKIDGSPMVTYYNATDTTLNLYECGDPICSTGQTHVLTDGSSDEGKYSSIVRISDDDDAFAISYYDDTADDLKLFSFQKTVTSNDLGSTSNYFAELYTAEIFTQNASISNFDVAEEYFVEDQSIGAGDVVRFKNNTDNELLIEKTTKAYDTGVIGVVSTEPGLYLKSWENSNNRSRPVALIGRVPVKVTDENGIIKKGDYLTASSTPGYAMKSTDGGFIIGRAIEDFEPERGGDSLDVKNFLEDEKEEAAEYLAKYADLSSYSNLSANEIQEIEDNILRYTEKLETLTKEIETNQFQDLNIGRIMMYVDLSYVGSNAFENDITNAFDTDEGKFNYDLFAFFKLKDNSLTINAEELVINGKVSLKGDLNVLNKISATSAQLENVKISQKITLPDKLSGKVKLPINTQEAFINTNKITEDSLIFLTPNDPSITIEIVEIKAGEGFQIKTSSLPPTDFEVNYIIIN